MSIASHEATDAALIGHTGFVGSTLKRQASFAQCFNSANIETAAGRRFGTVVCAAAPGSMLEANSAPHSDRAKVHALIRHLANLRTDRFILISSIAVLADFAGGDDEATTAFQTKLAYGRHRRELEEFVEQRFADHLIVRLPALFGHGLRKNFVFDLMNPVPSLLTHARIKALQTALEPALAAWVEQLYTPDPATGMQRLDRLQLNRDSRRTGLEQAVVDSGFGATQFHNPATTYQYYAMDRLWSDIMRAKAHGLSHLHLVAEPLQAARIHEAVIGRAMPETGARMHHEDMRTSHADLWDAKGPYQFTAQATLDALGAFFAAQRAAA